MADNIDNGTGLTFKGLFTRLRGRWRTQVAQWLIPTMLCTDVDGPCDKLVTEINHQFTTLIIHVSWQQLQQSAGSEIWLVPTKFKWFMWPNDAPFRDDLPSVS